MCRDAQIRKALAYFTDPHHLNSYEILDGTGNVMLSAPHAVLQTRHGRIKHAERYTGMLAKLCSADMNVPCIYKSRHMHDDANHDPTSDYRDALAHYVKTHAIRYVLDLHQLAPSRPMALCIGTGYGQNLHGDNRAVQIIQAAFAARGLAPITIDDPFAASKEYTVSSAVSRACGICVIQLELNTSLLVEDTDACRFSEVWDALSEIITNLNSD